MKRFLLGTNAFDIVEVMYAFFACVFLAGGLAVGGPEFIAGNTDLSNTVTLSVILNLIGILFVALGLHTPNLRLKDSGIIRLLVTVAIFVMVFAATVITMWFALMGTI